MKRFLFVIGILLIVLQLALGFEIHTSAEGGNPSNPDRESRTTNHGDYVRSTHNGTPGRESRQPTTAPEDRFANMQALTPGSNAPGDVEAEGPPLPASPSSTTSIPPTPTKASLTIVVLGRSGSGISSTVRELIGPQTHCNFTNGEETLKDILEYTISRIRSPEGNDFQIKLVDIPGFVDGRTMEQDSQILASLKSYLHNDGFPKFFLALSRFDDNRIDGEHSLFVKFLKRVDIFQHIFFKDYRANNNTVFLLTRLMSETRSTQRKPEKRINDFRRVIEEYTSFPSPVSIVVGENKAESEYGVRIENGYYRLPNKQHYPKNVWEMLLNATENVIDQAILSSIMNSREQPLECGVKTISADWDYYDEDAEDYLYLIQHPNITIENNDVNSEIDRVFETLNTELKFQGIVQKTTLQLRLQNMNITSVQALPTTHTERANFFQSCQTSGVGARLLDAAFGLRMPEYIQSLNVGYGYDILHDELSTETPFKADIVGPSGVGYELPLYLKCRKFSTPDVKYFKTYSQNYSDYFHERMKYLDFPNKQGLNESKFEGKVKEGFNVQPEPNDNVVTLSAVQEVRTLKCVLDRNYLIPNDEFLSALESLSPFDDSDKDSVNEWQNWFSRFGSHIVTQAYGGGSLHGSVVGPNVRTVLASESDIADTLDAIVKYTPFPKPNLGSPSYRLYGGDRDPQTGQLYDLDGDARNQLLSKWTNSLKHDFIMLNNEFTLVPISSFVEIFTNSTEQANNVEAAMELLLKGKLEYSRRRNRPSSGTGGQQKQPKTRRPKTTTTKAPIESPITHNAHGSGNNPSRPSDTIGVPFEKNQPTGQHSIGQSQYSQFPTTSSPSYSSLNNYNGHGTWNRESVVPANGIDSNSGQEALLSQLNSTNAAVDLLQQNVEDKRRRDEQSFRTQMLELERVKEEQARKNEERLYELKRSSQQTNEENKIFVQRQLTEIERQAALDNQRANDQLMEMKRNEEQREREHRAFLEILRRRREEEERQRLEREREKREKCSGWKSVQPWCWG